MAEKEATSSETVAQAPVPTGASFLVAEVEAYTEGDTLPVVVGDG